MSVKDINKKMYIQNLTNGNIKEIPYFADTFEENEELFKEILYLEIRKALYSSDSFKIFITY